MNFRYFSIIIPAHNEELYIGRTLSALKEIDYPSDKFDIVIVENGSSDKTEIIARSFEDKNITVYSINEKGVSKARNYGLRHIGDQAEWVVVVDADTYFKKNFLRDLNAFFQTHKDIQYGMTTLTPDTSTFRSRFWFGYRNFTDKMLKTLDTVHILSKEILSKLAYDENFNYTEDLQFAKKCAEYGRYFFFKTDQVITSTRRFEQQGYTKMFVKNLYIGILFTINPKIFRHKEWKPIR